VVAAALIAGLVADQAFRVGAFGLGASLALAFLALALVFVARAERLESRLLAGAAAVFAAWLSMRASPWLVWPDLAAGLILVGTAASFARRGTLLNIGMAESAAQGFHAMLHWVAGAPWAVRPITAMRAPFASAAPVARGLLIATPVAVVVAALLASRRPCLCILSHCQPRLRPAVGRCLLCACRLACDGRSVAFGCSGTAQQS